MRTIKLLLGGWAGIDIYYKRCYDRLELKFRGKLKTRSRVSTLKLKNMSNLLSEETKYGKKLLIWFIFILFVVSGITWFFTRAEKTVDTALIRYEEFQEIYNTCEKVNTDLCNMKEMPADDKSFEQFTKPQRINTLKTTLNKWVQDYNAKSKMWNRSMWKSKELPYQLDVNQFNCYTH